MLQISANTSNPLTMLEIQTEFGGAGDLLSYSSVGNGYIAKHQQNEGITSLSMLSFLGASNAFTANVVSNNTPSIAGFYSEEYSINFYGISSYVGSINYNRIGLSKSNTSQTRIIAGYDEYTNYGGYISRIVFSGDVRGTWWNTIKIDNYYANNTFYNTNTYSRPNVGVYTNGGTIFFLPIVSYDFAWGTGQANAYSKVVITVP